MRVLVVEDNPDLGPYLKQGLEEQGFAVNLVPNAGRSGGWGLVRETPGRRPQPGVSRTRPQPPDPRKPVK